MTAPKHPAPYSPAILDVMATMVRAEADRWDQPVEQLTILDPMAGTGRVHRLPGRTHGIEIEPEWAAMHKDTKVGDATALPFRDGLFHVIAVSPAYGNRFADYFDAKDDSTRRSYGFDLGRRPSPGSSGTLRYGPEYRELHERAWREAVRVLAPDGLFILNVSDFVRKEGGRQRIVQVAEWHIAMLFRIGLRMESCETVGTRRMRYGANRDARVDGELVVGLRKP